MLSWHMISNNRHLHLGQQQLHRNWYTKLSNFVRWLKESIRAYYGVLRKDNNANRVSEIRLIKGTMQSEKTRIWVYRCSQCQASKTVWQNRIGVMWVAVIAYHLPLARAVFGQGYVASTGSKPREVSMQFSKLVMCASVNCKHPGTLSRAVPSPCWAMSTMSSSSWKDLQNRTQVCCRQTSLRRIGAGVDSHTVLEHKVPSHGFRESSSPYRLTCTL